MPQPSITHYVAMLGCNQKQEKITSLKALLDRYHRLCARQPNAVMGGIMVMVIMRITRPYLYTDKVGAGEIIRF